MKIEFFPIYNEDKAKVLIDGVVRVITRQELSALIADADFTLQELDQAYEEFACKHKD